MSKTTILGIKLNPTSKLNTLEHIKKYIKHPSGFYHIVSLNPENIIIAQSDGEFKKTIEKGQIQIVDGVGIVLAGRLLGFQVKKLTGVELMEELLKVADQLRLRVLLIGGKPNLALRLAECYSRAYKKAEFLGLEGFKDIKGPLKSEEQKVFSIVSDFKPHLLFVSFGSPDQELWLDRHKNQLTGIVCMGVGGAFDYAGGIIPRAPKIIRTLGFEWLFRLVAEPWRWRRQLKLIKFIWLVLKQKVFNIL